MVFELRIHEPAESCATALRPRFEIEVLARFAKHDVDLMGMFTNPEAQTSNDADRPLIKTQIISVLEPLLPDLPLA